MTMLTSMAVRDFTPADYERYAEVINASYPDYGWTVAEMRHEDEGWDHAKHFKSRLVAEAGGRIVGVGETGHWPGRFQPDNYSVDVVVDPEQRRRGHGRTLYDALETILRSRNAHLVRTGVKESMSDGVAFARANGYRELSRDWESRLDVASFDEA